MKIKRLSIKHWMKHKIPDHYIQTNPLLHKEGLYLNRITRVSWFEVYVNGVIEAYLYDPKSFYYNLSTLNASEFNTRVHQTLKLMVQNNIATKKQQELYMIINSLGNQKYQRLHIHKIKKRLKELLSDIK